MTRNGSEIGGYVNRAVRAFEGPMKRLAPQGEELQQQGYMSIGWPGLISKVGHHEVDDEAD